LFVIAQGVANCGDISRTVIAIALYTIHQLHAFEKKDLRQIIAILNGVTPKLANLPVAGHVSRPESRRPKQYLSGIQIQ
jgi:hypothetical protein